MILLTREILGQVDHPWIILIDDNRSILPHSPEEFSLLFLQPFQASQTLEMNHLDVGDQSHVGLCNLGEPPDLTRHIHPHLENNHLFFFRQVEESHGKPDEVVQVPLRFENGKSRFQARRDHLLGRRLSIASGQGD